MNKPKTALKYFAETEEMYDKHFTKTNINYLYLYFFMHYAFEANRDYKNSTHHLKQLYDMILLSNNSNVHVLISNQLPIIDEFNRLRASMEDMAYLQQSLRLINKIFGKDSLYASKYHYLLGTLFQNSLQKETAGYHFNTALGIMLHQNITDPSLKRQKNSNISLIKEKLDSLK